MGPEIYAAAEAKGVDIYFEASVGGAIPFLKPLRESLVGDKVTSMLGIVNGTTNYILDEMTTKGLDFDDVLKDAQAKGYAEADPTGDIEGYDAANKAAIMATLGFHTSVTIDDVSVEGITKITADDIAAATAENKVIKLLAVVENTDAGVSARVYPALISNTHPLASVHAPSTPCSSRPKLRTTSCSTAAAPAALRPLPRSSATWSPKPAISHRAAPVRPSRCTRI